MYMCACTCGGQRSTFGVLCNKPPPYILRKCLSLELSEVRQFSQVASQIASQFASQFASQLASQGIPCCCFPHWDYRWAASTPSRIGMSAPELNCNPHTCMQAKYLPSETSPHHFFRMILTQILSTCLKKQAGQYLGRLTSSEQI